MLNFLNHTTNRGIILTFNHLVHFCKTQKLTLDALGLTKMNKVVERPDNASIRGMIKKVQHLVAIVEE